MHPYRDRFTEGFSGLIVANVSILMLKNGDFKVPAPIDKPVYWILVIAVFVSLYWFLAGLNDRYGFVTW